MDENFWKEEASFQRKSKETWKSLAIMAVSMAITSWLMTIIYAFANK